VLHLVIGEIEEAGKDKHEVGILEGFEAFDVGSAGFDETVFIDTEADGGFKAVVFGQDAGEGGAGFFGAVFVVGGDEDEVFSFAGAGFAFVGDLGRDGQEGEEKEQDYWHSCFNSSLGVEEEGDFLGAAYLEV